MDVGGGDGMSNDMVLQAMQLCCCCSCGQGMGYYCMSQHSAASAGGFSTEMLRQSQLSSHSLQALALPLLAHRSIGAHNP
jgi:hypothetical protein